MRTRNLLYIFLVCLSVILSFHGVLSLSFWKDDWGYIYRILLRIPFPIIWLHPATALEFTLLSPLFGFHPFYWHIVGILLKILASFSIGAMVHALTGKEKTGYIAGILSSVTPMAMETVSWPSVHVVLVAMICSSQAVHMCIRYFKTKQNIFRIGVVAFTFFGVISDPSRTILLLPMLFLSALFYKQIKYKFSIKQIVTGILIFFFGLSVSAYVFREFYIHHTVFIKIIDILQTPYVIPTKLYVIGNYFQSIMVQFFGWAFWFNETNATVAPNKICAWSGVGICVFFGIYLRHFWKKYTEKMFIILYFCLWTFLFYIPNWLFEPRLVSGVTNHYIGLSSIGIIGIIAYGIGTIEKKYTRVLLFLAVFILQYYYVNGELQRNSMERSEMYAKHMLQSVETVLPQ